MIIEFKHKNGHFYDIKKRKETLNSDYASYMLDGYNICFININRFNINDCCVYYIRDFYNLYKNSIRKIKINNLLK